MAQHPDLTQHRASGGPRYPPHPTLPGSHQEALFQAPRHVRTYSSMSHNNYERFQFPQRPPTAIHPAFRNEQVMLNQQPPPVNNYASTSYSPGHHHGAHGAPYHMQGTWSQGTVSSSVPASAWTNPRAHRPLRNARSMSQPLPMTQGPNEQLSGWDGPYRGSTPGYSGGVDRRPISAFEQTSAEHPNLSRPRTTASTFPHVAPTATTASAMPSSAPTAAAANAMPRSQPTPAMRYLSRPVVRTECSSTNGYSPRPLHSMTSSRSTHQPRQAETPARTTTRRRANEAQREEAQRRAYLPPRQEAPAAALTPELPSTAAVKRGHFKKRGKRVVRVVPRFLARIRNALKAFKEDPEPKSTATTVQDAASTGEDTPSGHSHGTVRRTHRRPQTLHGSKAAEYLQPPLPKHGIHGRPDLQRNDTLTKLTAIAEYSREH